MLGGIHRQPLVIDKGIHLVARGAVFDFSGTLALEHVLVHGLPAGQSFVLSGFALQDGGSPPATAARIQVRDCDGLVHLGELRSVGGLTLWSIAASRVHHLQVAASQLRSLQMTSSTAVVERCFFEPLEFSGLTMTDSTAAVVGSTLVGSNSPFYGPGASLQHSTLALSQSTVRGSA